MKVCCFDGGGVRALIPLQICKYIEAKTGKRMADLFDGFAGTSTGSILALGFAKKNPLSAVALEQLYLSQAAQIFPHHWYSTVSTVWGLKHTKYGTQGLEVALQTAFGEEKLTDLAKPVCIPTFDATAFETLQLTKYHGWKLWEAARASSAGPTYFEPFIKAGHAFIDGGVVANNPSAEARTVFGLDQNDVMLSLGTGVPREGWTPQQLTELGELRWLSPLLTVFTDGQSENVHRLVQNDSVQGNYLRTQATIPSALAPMDSTDPAILKALIDEGQKLVDNSRAELDAFITRLV